MDAETCTNALNFIEFKDNKHNKGSKININFELDAAMLNSPVNEKHHSNNESSNEELSKIENKNSKAIGTKI